MKLPSNAPEGDRPIDAALVAIDLPAFIKQIKGRIHPGRKVNEML